MYELLSRCCGLFITLKQDLSNMLSNCFFFSSIFIIYRFCFMMQYSRVTNINKD